MRDGREVRVEARAPRRRRARWLGALAALVGLAATLQPGPATAATVQQPATVTREAYFTHPITQATPPLLRNGFPPATACLVAGLVGVPQVCGSEIQQVAALLGLTDGLPIPITPDGDLAQPIALPGTTPVGMLGGQQRYASLIQVAVPPLPDGERYGSFELVLHQDGFNFAIESPALRDLVLQVVAQLESDRDPTKVTDALTRALTGEVPLATDTITGIEACPITENWNAGRAQGASLDGTRLPDTSCLTGSTGSFDAATGTWTFDLTFAVQAWTEGADGGPPLANEGIMLRPVGAPNLAYGDPDLSTNWVVSLADSTTGNAALRPSIRYTTVPDDDGVVVDPDTSLDFPSDPISGGDVDLGPLPSDTGGTGGEVALPDRPPTAVASRGTEPHTPGWVWIALPLGLLGAYLFEQSLRATPAATRRRPGALSRLEAEKQ